MKMPFGKYKGTELNDLPELDFDYFYWLSTIELKGRLLEEMKDLIEVHKNELTEHKEFEEQYYIAMYDFIHNND